MSMYGIHYTTKLLNLLQANKQCTFELGNEATNELPPGAERLGADLRQHEAALDLAFQQDAPRVGPSGKDLAGFTQEVDRLVAATRTALTKQDQSAAKQLLALNLQLERQVHSSSPTIGRHHADVLQRKLLANLPAATKLTSTAQDATALQQLRWRCAIAKGRHQVEYAGHVAALELLTLLAQQNNPGVKVVLRLPQAPYVKARTSTSDCAGEFELSFDVRGTLIPQPFDQLPVSRVQEVDEQDVFRLQAGAEMVLRREWDTAMLVVPPQGTAPALALEACSMVMSRLLREGRTTCLVVRQDLQSGELLLTLAETQAQRKGLLLLNSPHVVQQAQDVGRRFTRPHEVILQRLAATSAGCQAILQRLGVQDELSTCDSVISRMLGDMRQLPLDSSAFDYSDSVINLYDKE